MANGFEYETALKDGMSGPARAEVQSLKALQGEIRATEAAIRGLQAEKLLYQRSGAKKAAAATGFDIAEMRLGLSGMKATIRDIKPPTETTGFFSSFSSSLLPNIVAGELAASAIKGIGSAIVSVAEDIGRLGFETAKYIVDVADFKRNAENAYEILLGTREEGEKAFKGFEDLGMAIHAPTEKAEHIAQDLLLQGEKNLGTVRHVIQAVTDLQRVGLEQGATQLESIINRSLTTGFLTLPRRVSGLGIQLPELYENLAKRLHTSVDNIKKEIKKGTLDAEVGIDELTKAITGGKVGDVALTKLGIGDAITDIKNAFRSVFEGVNTQPIVQGLENVRYLFEDITGTSGAFGEGTKGFIDEIAAGIGELDNRIVDYGLKLEISFLKAKIAARETFGDTGGIENWANKVVELVGDFKDLIDAVKDVISPLSWFASGVIDDIGNISFTISDMSANREARERAGAEAPIAGEGPAGPSAEDIERDQPHAAGGVVQPAQGEVFASVAPGETIVPAGAMNIPDFSQMGEMMGGNKGDTNVTVEAGAVQVHAPQGASVSKEDLQELTEQAMDDLVERLVNELGG